MSESRWDQPPYTMDEFYREMDEAKVQQFKSILVSSNTPIETPIKERFKEILEESEELDSNQDINISTQGEEEEEGLGL